MSEVNKSMSIAQPHPSGMDGMAKIGLAFSVIGLLVLVVAFLNIDLPSTPAFLAFAICAMVIGTSVYAWRIYMHKPAGIKNDLVYLASFTGRGIWGWLAGIVLTGFYVLLYWFPEFLGLNPEGNTGLIGLFDPLKKVFTQKESDSQWFVYGTLYTVAILSMGIKFIFKYRNNAYQVIRTVSVMFWQLGFAFLLPEILSGLNSKTPYNDFKNMWPLNYYYTDEWSINGMLDAGGLGMFMLLFGVAMIFIISPILTYFYGKRWYCSWVCGCGGLAETAGDPWRQLSDKSLTAWKIERWLIHSVLVFVIISTIAVVFTYVSPEPGKYWITRSIFSIIVTLVLGMVAMLMLFWGKFRKEISPNVRYLAVGISVVIIAMTWMATQSGSQHVFYVDTYAMRKAYGFYIGSVFAGVAGVGFYPLLGTRVWCRFGCPMAAILGLQQKFFSRFRITTNGGQCISCGNCSTYCEMGIDVRAYAQKGQNIVRSSCVGCGICSAVCPRGVLKLENGPVNNKVSDDPILIGNEGVRLNTNVV